MQSKVKEETSPNAESPRRLFDNFVQIPNLMLEIDLWSWFSRSRLY